MRKQSQNVQSLIFIHINKTAGTSIERSLEIPTAHFTAQEKINRIGRDEWDASFSFSVIRNPWDRVVSQYHYRLLKNQTNLQQEGIDFKEWVIRAYGDRDPIYYNNPKMFMPCYSWISDNKGEVVVKHLLQFECLQRDFSILAKKLHTKKTIPHVKKSGRGAYQQYFDEKTKSIIDDRFKIDISHFRYKY